MAGPTRTLDSQIDRLYQLPLEEFTDARNALAKDLGKDGASVRKLPKPPVAAWAINQLYWSRRPVYDSLVAAASSLRNAHAQLLAGKRADLRAAGTAHEEAFDAALKEAMAILAAAGHPASDTTRQSVINTLRALPSAGDTPGRLARTLQPGGFEMIAGLPIASAAGRAAPKPAAPAPPPEVRDRPEPREKNRQRERLVKAKESLGTAQRQEKAAEQQSKRDEFEAARAAREAERAEGALADAREALEAAQAVFDEAEAAAGDAARKKETTARRARESADALARARVRSEAARAELNRLE